MQRDKPKYWKIIYSPEMGERKSPHDFINGIEEKASIYLRLSTLENIKIPREWPGSKPITHDKTTFQQVTIGRYRVYIFLDTRDDFNLAVVCHACPKVSRKTKRKDLDRIVTHIRKYQKK